MKYKSRVTDLTEKTTMADVKDETETSNKEAGPSSMKFSMLTFSNYTVWAMRMIIALKVNKV